MPCIVYHTDPKNGITYAYESRSFRDPETKKVRTKKTYVGRVDSITGEIIPKSSEPGKRNRTPRVQDIPEQTRKQIETLAHEVTELKARLRTSHEFIETVLSAAANYQSDADSEEA